MFVIQISSLKRSILITEPRETLGKPPKRHFNLKIFLVFTQIIMNLGPRCTRSSPVFLTSLVGGHLRLQVLGGHVELGLLVHRGPRFTFPAAAVTAAAQTTAEVTAGGQTAEDEQGLKTGQKSCYTITTSSSIFCACSAPVWPPYLRPPAGQHKVGVDVLLPELLGHVQTQRAVLVVDVLLRGVAQDRVGVVDFLELLRRVRVVRVLVRVELQSQFPGREDHSLCQELLLLPGSSSL